MSRAAPARGQPIVALALMLTAWIAARAVILQADDSAAGPASGTGPLALQGGGAAAFVRAPPAPTRSEQPPAGSGSSSAFPRTGQAIGHPVPNWSSSASTVHLRPAVPLPSPLPAVAPALPAAATAAPSLPRPAFAPVPPERAGGHLALWMAAVGHLPLPHIAARVAAPASRQPGGSDQASLPRWSADGWLLLRRGGSVALANGPAGPTYGASQTGAVVRYRLAPASGHRPAAYLRATGALNGSQEREVAAGLSARPDTRLPVSVAAELRVTGNGGSLRLRPAISAVTELPPVSLPAGLRSEAYGQAGYVWGRGSTAFVDGQLRIDGPLASPGPAELRAGAGAWGGAQKGAARLDIGPTATLGFRLTPAVSGRLGVDWRLRVAGRAAPASGPAITLSAGF